MRHERRSLCFTSFLIITPTKHTASTLFPCADRAGCENLDSGFLAGFCVVHEKTLKDTEINVMLSFIGADFGYFKHIKYIKPIVPRVYLIEFKINYVNH